MSPVSVVDHLLCMQKIPASIINPWFSKPSITLTPTQQISTGMNVSIECQGAESYLTFSLFKSNNLIASQEAEENRNATKFFFSEVRLEDGGSYTCRYHRIGFPFRWSESSDPMELVVTGKALSKPSIKVLPNERISPGQNITIECQGPEKGLNFSLYKSGELITSQVTESERNRAEFPFFNVGLEDEGNYTCQYHRRGNPFAWSEPSNATELVVRGEKIGWVLVFPLPSKSHSLLWRRQELQGGLNFSLYKSGELITSQVTESERNRAEFPFFNVGLEDEGNYTCQYHRRGNPFAWSEPSNATDHTILTVFYLHPDPSLSKPSIKVLPDERISPGQNITIECQGPEKGLNFSLYKSGELITSQVTESERNRAEFPFFNVGLEDEGNYTCQYHRRGNPFAWSEPSNATELVVRGEKIGWVLVFPLPSKSRSLLWRRQEEEGKHLLASVGTTSLKAGSEMKRDCIRKGILSFASHVSRRVSQLDREKDSQDLALPEKLERDSQTKLIVRLLVLLAQYW
uniref:Ig-like domain-containing protein n=1 Tax=Podarcis muralis TaxID=64176 RepID=A0A670K3A5_PODMU